METILGKLPAILNGHQPPRADYPYTDLHNDKRMEKGNYAAKPFSYLQVCVLA